MRARTSPRAAPGCCQRALLPSPPLGWRLRPRALPGAPAAVTAAARPALLLAPRRHVAAGAAAASTAAPGGAPTREAAGIAASLQQLQHSASSLNDWPSVDGLLTAFQQLQAIQRQLQQERRRVKVELFRAARLQQQQQDQQQRQRGGRTLARRARGPAQVTATQLSASVAAAFAPDAAEAQQAGGAAGAQASPEAAAAAAVQQLEQQLAALNELGAGADDAQDFLLGLVQQLLQEEPPAGCNTLLASAAYRQLNVQAINQLAVNAFIAKQADASPRDMAGLMAALALVRCCGSGGNQVEGFRRQQLTSLFSGTLSHLVAHVQGALQEQQQQQVPPAAEQQVRDAQPQGAAACELQPLDYSSGDRRPTRRRRRASTLAMEPAAVAAAEAAASAAPGGGKVAADHRRQVAAALAAHVTARVPLNSSLVPALVELLQDEAPTWLHPIAAVKAAPSVRHLSGLVTHPSRYDYAYLAAALQRLSELVEQRQWQQQGDEQGSSSGGGREAAVGDRLASVLAARLQRLQADATPSELLAVVTAAAKLGPSCRPLLVSATQALLAASDGSSSSSEGSQPEYLTALMYAAATACGGSCRAADSAERKQLHALLRGCTQRLAALVQADQEQRRQQQQQHREQPLGRRRLPAARASPRAAAGPRHTTEQQQRAEAPGVQPSALVMALWSLASADVRQVPAAHLAAIFEHLAQPEVVQALTCSSSGGSGGSGQAEQQQQDADEVARSCGTVVWAASKLGYRQGPALLKPCLEAFLGVLHTIPVPCSSITTVLLALASIIAQQEQQAQQQKQQQQQQQRQQEQQQARRKTQSLAPRGEDEGNYWRSRFLMCSAEAVARLQQQVRAAAAAAAEDGGGSSGEAAALAAAGVSQIMWAYQEAGLTPSHAQVDALLQLAGHLAPASLARLAWGRHIAAWDSLDAAQEGLQLPAAAAALGDLGCAAAACRRVLELLQLQEQQQQQQQQAGKALARRCLGLIGAHGLPAILAASQQANAPAAEAAEAAAAIMWAAAQVQHRDAQLASACLQAFAAVAREASPGSAAAVVCAMAEAGRGVTKVYGCDSSAAAEVVAACTDTLLQALPQHHTAAAAAAAAADGGSTQLAGCGAAVLAQKLLQLHAALGLQPPAAQAYQLLSVVADEANLAGLRDNAALAALVASLAAVAELSAMPGWHGLGSRGSRNQAAAAGDSSSSQVPLHWHTQQQLVLQQLWQQLLLGGLLPRLQHATPKQVATAMEAAAQLATLGSGGGSGDAGHADLDIGLAKDFARAVLDALAPQQLLAPSAGAGGGVAASVGQQLLPSLHHPGAADIADPDMRSQWHSGSGGGAAAAGDTAAAAPSSAEPFLGAWRAGEWKGEHVVAVALAAVQLDVQRPSFMAALEQELLLAWQPQQQPQQQPVQGPGEAAGSGGQRSRLASVQLQHLVAVCCAAAALDCRAPRLLALATQAGCSQLDAEQQRQSGQHATQPPPAAAAAGAAAARPQQRKGGSMPGQPGCEPQLLLLLGWAIAIMDQPRLVPQAQQLAAAGLRGMRAAMAHGRAGTSRPQQQQEDEEEGASALPDALAARLFQLHVWLLDMQRAASGPADGGAVSGHQGLSSALALPQELRRGRAAWLRLQRGFNASIEAVAGALEGLMQLHLQQQPQEQQSKALDAAAAAQHQLHGLPAVQGLQQQQQQPAGGPLVHAATEDGLLSIDVAVRLCGVPVAVLLLDDAEDAAPAAAKRAAHTRMASLVGGAAGAAAAADTGAADGDGSSGHDDPAAAPHAGAGAEAAPARGRAGPPPRSASPCSQRLQDVLAAQRVGDVMFRTKALAARGHWVEVVSCRQWLLLEGHRDAEVALLQDRLWVLLQQEAAQQQQEEQHDGAHQVMQPLVGN